MEYCGIWIKDWEKGEINRFESFRRKSWNFFLTGRLGVLVCVFFIKNAKSIKCELLARLSQEMTPIIQPNVNEIK